MSAISVFRSTFDAPHAERTSLIKSKHLNDLPHKMCNLAQGRLLLRERHQ